MTSIFCDVVVLPAVNVVLALLVLVAVLQDVRAKRSRGIGLQVKRGENSMNFLYIFYGIASVIYALIVQVAEAAQGYKAAIIVADYLGLTYLCFFNGWFRNKVIALYIRIQTD